MDLGVQKCTQTPCWLRPCFGVKYIVLFCIIVIIFSCFLGDPTLKHALLEEQDISPENERTNLMQTEDQNLDTTPFVHLEPPLNEEDYIFSLEDSEGISDLFDAYDFKDFKV